MAAVIFDSWDDYITYSPNALEEMKNDTYECYMKNHDFIYIPKEYEDKTDSISSIIITPEYFRITFNIDNKKIDFCYFFYASDIDVEPFDYSSAKKNGENVKIGITDTYRYVNEWESNVYFKYDNNYFSVGTDFEFQFENDVRVTKIFADSHLQEKGGNIFYISDKGDKESGWKTVNGHSYFFRSSDKTAICGKKANIGGIVYSFNQDGICKGKFTGYALGQNGEKIHYKDGIAVK